MGMYIKGLGEELMDKLAAQEEMPDLKTLNSLTTHLDIRLGETKGEVQI